MEVTMGEKKYPAIKPKFLSGDKPLLDTEGKQVAQLVDYWSWAHSDLIIKYHFWDTANLWVE